MEIFRIIDEIELMLKDSRKIPLSGGKSIVDSNRLLDRLDRIRAILPEDLERAKYLLEDRERIVKQAFAEADEFIEQSKDHAARLVDENEITRNALQMAEDIVNQAHGKALEMKRDADEYAAGVLTHIEMVLKNGLEAISQGKEALRDDYKNTDY